MTESLKDSTYTELLLWLLRKRKRFRVTGLSMMPMLKPGEEILVDFKAYQKSPPQVGDLVVAIHPNHPDLQIIKRVAFISEDGSCFLQGDNLTESTDSRAFGVVALEKILGKVTSRFA